MRIAGAIATSLWVATAMPAYPEDSPLELYYGNVSKAGRPEGFVPPKYPEEALSRKVTGYVDVTGRVDGSHMFMEPEFHAGTPEAEIFVPELRDVARFWSFFPAYEKDGCHPSMERVGVRVFFELDAAGAPHISIEIAKAQPKPPLMKAKYCPKPRYPRQPLRSGYMANVFSRVSIKPDGTVSTVETDVYPKRGITDLEFSETVVDALKNCQFEPVDNPERRRAACYEVQFKIDD